MHQEDDVDIYIPRINTLVEFDGAHHYQTAKVIVRDQLLSEFCQQKKIRLVRIPYWLQLDCSVFQWAFGSQICKKYITNKIKLGTKYPHGFISDSCVLPADFSILGWNRFASEYSSLITPPNEFWSVAQAVWHSIETKSVQFGKTLTLGASNLHKLTPKMFWKHYPT